MVRDLTGRGRLTERNVRDALKEVRAALLEADVALPVVKQFIERVRARALGSEVMRSLTPGQAMIKIVRDELVTVLGAEPSPLDLGRNPPVVVLVVGLQGAGKTTTAGKLAHHLVSQERKRVLAVSVDIHRPAAMEQLETLCSQAGCGYFRPQSQEPAEIAAAATREARRRLADVLIIDSAGRLHVDDGMMREVEQIHRAAEASEVLFVIDSMAGQDAAQSARSFADRLPLSGIIVSKCDSDARGGAALSARLVTGAPIKFLGIGEKLDALEVFHADRVASRILGMGDVLSLIEDLSRQSENKETLKLAAKLKKGKGFDFNDMRKQMASISEMGGISSLFGKLPAHMKNNLPSQVPDGQEDRIKRMIAAIDSMTGAERKRPDLINGSRRRRIAGGSGCQIQDVNQLMKQLKQMNRAVKKTSKAGLEQRIMQQLGGGSAFRGH